MRNLYRGLVWFALLALNADARLEDCAECRSYSRENPVELRQLAQISNFVESDQPECKSKPIDFSQPVKEHYCAANEKTTRVRKAGYDVSFLGLSGKIHDKNVPWDQRDSLYDMNNPVGFNFQAEDVGETLDGVDPEMENEEPGDGIESVSPRRNWSFQFSGGEGFMQIVNWATFESRNPSTKKTYARYASTEMRLRNFQFFPRKMTPSIKPTQIEVGGLQVEVLEWTLPTGEKTYFDAKTKTVVSGVFSESPRKDKGIEPWRSGKDPAYEKYGQIRRIFPETDASYTGKGVWIETVVEQNHDARRGDGLVSIRTGSPDPACIAGVSCTECKVPASKLWVRKFGQLYPDNLNSTFECWHSAFKTDAEFDAFLKSNCKFSLPKSL